MQLAQARIDEALTVALARGETRGAPPRLAAAIRHAVWPGGARIRPQLCLAVAAACGDPDPLLSESAAAAIELMFKIHRRIPCGERLACSITIPQCGAQQQNLRRIGPEMIAGHAALDARRRASVWRNIASASPDASGRCSIILPPCTRR